MERTEIEERVLEAKRLFKEDGYNCCQAVVMAYCDIFGMERKTAAAIASGFGGGMGRMREVCGTVSAMVMLSGLLSPASDPSDKAARTANYALVQELAGKFRDINGSIVCRELLGFVPHGAADGIRNESPEPSDRTPEYYKKRPCEELVGISARIIGEKLAEMEKKD